MTIRYETIERLSEMIKNNEIKPSEIVRDIFDAIEADDANIKAFLALDKEQAIKKLKNKINYKLKAKWKVSYLVFQWVSKTILLLKV